MAYLTDIELQALGVTRTADKYGEVYAIPCVLCGTPVTSRTFSVKRTYKCRVCANDLKAKREASNRAFRREVDTILAEQMGTDYDHMHRFEKGAAKFGPSYIDNIETARRAIMKYDSMPEVVACIELLHTGTRVIVHQPVGGYTVDFCLPDEKVVVEVDGTLYHNDAAKEYARDYALRNMLGDGWLVRHVPADAVVKDHAAFGRGMKRMLNGRRKQAGMASL